MKAVFFDIGGVVIKDQGLKQEANKHFEGVDPDELWNVINSELLLACQGKQALAEGWRSVANKFSVTLPDDVLQTLWIDDFRNGIEINEEVVALAQSLRTQCKLTVVSNTIAEHARILHELGVYDHFDELVLSHEIGATKDTQQIFKHALELRALEPKDVLFIDDVQRFLNVAADMGMRTHLFRGADGLRDELKSLGFAID